MRNRKVVGNIKTMGKPMLRYFTYYLIFPDDTVWVDQVPFANNDLEDELNKTTFGKIDKIRRSILKTNEASWKDENGVWSRVVVEMRKRPRVWGKEANYAAHYHYEGFKK